MTLLLMSLLACDDCDGKDPPTVTHSDTCEWDGKIDDKILEVPWQATTTTEGGGLGWMQGGKAWLAFEDGAGVDEPTDKPAKEGLATQGVAVCTALVLVIEQGDEDLVGLFHIWSAHANDTQTQDAAAVLFEAAWEDIKSVAGLEDGESLPEGSYAVYADAHCKPEPGASVRTWLEGVGIAGEPLHEWTEVQQTAVPRSFLVTPTATGIRIEARHEKGGGTCNSCGEDFVGTTGTMCLDVTEASGE